MFLILIVVTLENFLANTFYKEAPTAKERDESDWLIIRSPSSFVA